MNNLTNMEPGSQAATVQDPTNKEPRKKECRSAIGAKAQTILEFLRACSPYEADSIRVMVGYGMGKGDIGTIEATDMLAVNRFLNHGLTKERNRDETPSGACAKTHGSGQGICGYKPALPYQCRADENLIRFQGGGGCTAAPAIPIHC